jgi:deoxyribose-phosphate aldolase
MAATPEEVARRVAERLGEAGRGEIADAILRAKKTDWAPPEVVAIRELARFIDRTNLKPEATGADIDRLCDEAREFGFAAVCVNPSWIERCCERLESSRIKVCTVVGFPLGAMTTAMKAAEAKDAVGRGADEIDMVLHVGRLREGDFAYVHDDIRAVVEASGGRCVKVILEACLLKDEEKVAACLLARAAGAAFVKTSTGFAAAGATVQDVALMRAAVGGAMGVKAAGGIRDAATARAMIAAGATRIGASASAAIVGDG